MTEHLFDVVIIGAGPAGLVAAKTALECGLSVTVLERADDIGGIWNPMAGSPWKNMSTNLSKYTCSFSDFPWGEDIQDFPGLHQVKDYLDAYADHFNVRTLVNLNATVSSAAPLDDGWKIEFETAEKGKDFLVASNLIIATGFFSEKCYSNIANEKASGIRVIHSSDYWDEKEFVDKNVVVVGNSYSAVEICAELAEVSGRLTQLIRRPRWILPKHISNDSASHLPWDLFFNAKPQTVASDESIEQRNQRKHALYNTFSHQNRLGIDELNMDVESTEPTFIAISDRYLDLVERKKINLLSEDIQSLGEKAVNVDGESLDCDIIVLCTGYKPDLSYLDAGVLEALDYKFDETFQPLILSNSVVHPSFKNLGFVGMYRGPYFGVMELQARICCMLFAGMLSDQKAEQLFANRQEEISIRNTVPRPQFPRADYLELCYRLADYIGVKPDQDKLVCGVPLKHYPLVPAEFRLEGFANNEHSANMVFKQLRDTLKLESKNSECA